MRSLFLVMYCMILAAAAFFMQSCCGPLCQIEKSMLAGEGGGEDNVAVDMPFDLGYTAQCVQGPGGSYSHTYTSTRYDADFDTPNDADDPVYAPVGGVAYVHDDDRTSGFGVHVNVDMDDGTYVILGHMDEVFVDDGSEVEAVQMLGFEGTTGNSTGDHVHLGRHDGDARADGSEGVSLEGLTLRLYNATTGDNESRTMEQLICDMSYGNRYASELMTPRWHPNGSLVKTPDNADVALLTEGTARVFDDETAFWSRGYDFADVALVSHEEMACYGSGSRLSGDARVEAVVDGGTVWLVVQDDETVRYRVSSVGWQAVLKSWGITASTYDDLPSAASTSAFATARDAGTALFRDGSLVSEVSSSTVYVMSDRVAMPVETWDAYLLMGFEDRTVIEVDDGLVAAIMSAVGDCGTNAYCLTREDILTCGGPSYTDEGEYDATSTTDGDFSTAATDDTGDELEDDTMSSDGLVVTWSTPTGGAAERITLSGEYVHASGWSEGWQTLATATYRSSVTYTASDAARGDSLRFSVEFSTGSVVSWSCLAPYPPGTVQGATTASFDGTALAVSTADDPTSDGCGLRVTVP